MRKRTLMRVNVNWPVKIESMKEGSLFIEVKVLTFSAGGLSFKCSKEIRVGESFYIHLPFAKVPISVVRMLDDRYGALFINLSLEDIDLIQQNVYKDDGRSVLMEAISQF